ncbi:MAG: response regulator [Deltaproteobacteria bacterium]|nr:response regulator [Deltaproteobacteria bacterium]
MTVISIFSGTCCGEDTVVAGLVSDTGYELVRNADIVAEASALSGISTQKIGRALSAKTSVFNKFTHEKERSVAYIKLALAQILSKEELVIEGFASHLIPKKITHVLRICLMADMPFRIQTAIQERSLDEIDAVKLIRKGDEDAAAWVHDLLEVDDPWDASLYDMLLPTDKLNQSEIIARIREAMQNEAVQATPRSKRAVADFHLSAQVEISLIKEGHNVGVESKDGAVTLTVNKHVLMLSRLEQELIHIADQVPGVKSTKVRVGKDFYQADIYRKHDFEMPSKVLLVDDEREFVETLSERLLMRDMGSAVAYDGESALELIERDEPEVMILDLRMPGIDGIEVLRRVKQTNPDIEVIILTGHGSEADRETCMQLGAFAYLQKPVDIEKLSQTIKSANEKISQRHSTQTRHPSRK